MDENGIGVTQDENEAKRLYQIGERAIAVDAYYSIGRIYEYGLGVTQDINEANKCIEKHLKKITFAKNKI